MLKGLNEYMRFRGIKKKLAFFLVNHVYVGTRKFEKKRKLLKAIGFDIGDNTKIVGPVFWTASVTIGKDCWIGKNMSANGNGTLIIGDNVDVAPNVTFQTGGHKIGDKNRRAGEGESYKQLVEDGSWIGVNCTIIGNTMIGKSSVVAGCACVIRDVAPNTLVGGVPAKEIKRL